MHLFEFITVTASFLLILSPLVFAAAIHPSNTTTSVSSTLTPRDDVFNYDCQGKDPCFKGAIDGLIQLAESNKHGCEAGPNKLMYCFAKICVYTMHTDKPLDPSFALYSLIGIKTQGLCLGCGSVNLPGGKFKDK